MTMMLGRRPRERSPVRASGGTRGEADLGGHLRRTCRWAGATLVAVLATAAQAQETGAAAARPTPDRDVAIVDREAMQALVAAPAKATTWIRLRDGKGMLASPEAEAFARSLLSQIVIGEGLDRWNRLATKLGWSQREAFDRLCGVDLRCAVQTPAAAGGESDWVVLTTVTVEDVEHMVRSLRATILPNGRFEVADEHLLLAYRSPWLALGPVRPRTPNREAATPSLFEDIAERWTAPLELAPADEAALGRQLVARGISTLPPGRLTAAFSLDRPFDGVAALGADIVKGTLRASLRGACAHAPISGLKSTTLDISVLAHFKDRAMLACIDPVSTEVGPSIAAMVDFLPELVPHATFRANLGGRRLMLVGEREAGTGDHPKARRPAIAIAYEVDDAEQARADQDAYMKGLMQGVNERLAGLGGVAIPAPVIPERGPRTADVGPFLSACTGDHPLVRSWCLSWQVVREGGEAAAGAGPGHGERPRRAWQVYATDAEWLAAVRGSLESGASGGACEPQRAAHAGCGSGVRLASHLRSWMNDAKGFVGRDADAADIEEFKAGVELLAGIAERMSSMRWILDAPSEGMITLDVEATLVPPQSEGGQGR